MTERALYALPVDVVRHFKGNATQSDIDSNNIIGSGDRAKIRAHLDEAANEFEDITGKAYRLGRMGAPGATETYESADVINVRTNPPLWATLTRRPVLPFDSNSNDTLEVRTGKDSWTDVTDQRGNEFTIENRTGRIKIYRRLFEWIYWDARDDRYLRATYRYGALGGDQHEGGETTLDGSITNSDTSISVSNAARLPSNGIVSFGNSEYVRVTSVDYSTDTLTVSRGERATSAESHNDGDVVHYAPEGIRKAIAAKAAMELQQQQDWIADKLVDPDEQVVDGTERLDRWESTWESALANNSDVKRL